MRIGLAVLVMGMMGCSRGHEAPREARSPRSSPPVRAVLATHVARNDAQVAAQATAEGGTRSVLVTGSVPAACPGDAPLVQSYGPVDSALVLRVTQFTPSLCEAGIYGFRFTAVAQGVVPGRVPVEVQWQVTAGGPQGGHFDKVLLRDTVDVRG